MRPALDGRVDDVDGFLAEAYLAERPALTGQVGWPDVLPGLLERWGIADAYDEVLRLWLSIEPVEETHALVGELRAAGVRCYLATNQAEHRGRFMHDELGYAELFDATFYSYELGLAKPDPAYFRVILDRLDMAPEEAVFVDDNLLNVRAARDVGLYAEAWSYRRDLTVLREQLARHGLPVG